MLISDVHVGDGKSGYRDLIKFLDLQPDITELIILGDLFDLWVSSPGRAFKAGRDLLDFLQLRFHKVIYLLGNHDEDLSNLTTINNLHIKQFHDFEINGKKFICMHGQQYDRRYYTNQLEPVAKINATLVNWVDGWFGIDVRKWLMSLSDRVQGDPYDKFLNEFEMTLLTEFGARFDYVVTGHTHVPSLKIGGCSLCNTGDWIQNRTGIKITDQKIKLLGYVDEDIELYKEIRI